MKIIACVRQTPDTETIVKVADNGTSIKTDDIKYIIGPYDEYSLEAAVQIKDETKGEVTVLSMGPNRVPETLRACLARGGSKAVHVSTGDEEIDDALIVASALAEQVKKMGEYDVIFTSTKGSDSERGAVGPMLAELLGLAYVGLVSEIQTADGKFTCKRQVEGGVIETFTVSTPAVICLEQGVRGQPRYPSLMQIMKAKKKKIETVDFASLGVDSSLGKVEVEALEYPPERPPGRIIEGDSLDDRLDELVRLLKEEAKVL
jgi:electron transfer flavoprotein beta subunit